MSITIPAVTVLVQENDFLWLGRSVPPSEEKDIMHRLPTSSVFLWEDTLLRCCSGPGKADVGKLARL